MALYFTLYNIIINIDVRLIGIRLNQTILYSSCFQSDRQEYRE